MRFSIDCADAKEVKATLYTLADMVLAGFISNVEIKNLLDEHLAEIEGHLDNEGETAMRAEFRKRFHVLE